MRASNPQDEVFIVNFNDDAYLDVPLTSDIKKMEEGDGSHRFPRRHGHARRNQHVDDYVKKEGHRQKKVLLVITDGNDNASNISLEKLVTRAQQNEVLIYSIGLLNEEERREARLAKRALDAISRDSGGVAFYPKGAADVDAIALQVAHEIRNQYTIAYSPTVPADGWQLPPDQSYREQSGHPTVRTRTGYFATPDSAAKKTRSQLAPRCCANCTDAAPFSVARYTGISIASLAQPLFALAHGNLLGQFRPRQSGSAISGASPGSIARI